MSPKTNSLAYEEFIEEVDFTPELNLLVSKRVLSADAATHPNASFSNHPIMIRGSITVSF